VFPLDGLDYRRAAFTEPLACVLHAWRVLEPLPGKQVCIIGTGAMGYLHLMEACRRGCRVLMLGRRRSERLALAQQLGADATLQIAPHRTDLADPADKHALVQAVQAATGGGADVVIEGVRKCGFCPPPAGSPHCVRGTQSVRFPLQAGGTYRRG
jgi:threonine dehydrogenase-like Zn-dependent dehydrogenase